MVALVQVNRAKAWCFHYISSSMLDLSFVRDNLPRIEEMLRQRGMNPDIVLKDFRTIDGQRRQAWAGRKPDHC